MPAKGWATRNSSYTSHNFLSANYPAGRFYAAAVKNEVKT